VVHFALLVLGVQMIATAPWLGPVQALVLAIALGLFMGQVSNSNAHESIHAPMRWRRMLGTIVYVSLLFGHHASAHPKVHHVHVATARDPNSARFGQGFYHFWPRAWIGSFRAGMTAETAARARRQLPPKALTHPYVVYIGGAVLALVLAFWLAGSVGVLVYLGLAAYTQMQLLLADYVQHYGLRRRRRGDTRMEPAGPQHSWNAQQWYSTAMMLNAPRHSDHHMHPMRLFPALRLDCDTMPTLPYSLPVMAAIALVPPLWRQVIDPRVASWQAIQPTSSATPDNLPLSNHANDPDDSCGDDRSDDPADADGAGGNATDRRRI
jgi:alkane 1-monooxygenase